MRNVQNSSKVVGWLLSGFLLIAYGPHLVGGEEEARSAYLAALSALGEVEELSLEDLPMCKVPDGFRGLPSHSVMVAFGQLVEDPTNQRKVVEFLAKRSGVKIFRIHRKARHVLAGEVENYQEFQKLIMWHKKLRVTPEKLFVAGSERAKEALQQMKLRGPGPKHPVTVEICRDMVRDKLPRPINEHALEKVYRNNPYASTVVMPLAVPAGLNHLPRVLPPYYGPHLMVVSQFLWLPYYN